MIATGRATKCFGNITPLPPCGAGSSTSPSRCSMTRCLHWRSLAAGCRGAESTRLFNKEARKRRSSANPNERSMAYFIAACSTGATANWTMPAPVSAAPSSRTATPRTRNTRATGCLIISTVCHHQAFRRWFGRVEAGEVASAEEHQPCRTQSEGERVVHHGIWPGPAELTAVGAWCGQELRPWHARFAGFVRAAQDRFDQSAGRPCDDLNCRRAAAASWITLANKAVFKNDRQDRRWPSSAARSSPAAARHSHNDEIGRADRRRVDCQGFSAATTPEADTRQSG